MSRADPSVEEGRTRDMMKLLFCAISISCAFGCADTPSDPTSSSTASDPRAQPFLDEALQQSHAGSGSGEETAYDGCQWYGDCVYCEGRVSNWNGCVSVCYAFSCSGSGDNGSGCYDDCSWVGF